MTDTIGPVVSVSATCAGSDSPDQGEHGGIGTKNCGQIAIVAKEAELSVAYTDEWNTTLSGRQ